MAPKTRKPIHRACLRNLWHYLKGDLAYEEWSRRQEELESRLGPEPELPFEEERPARPGRPKAA